MLDDKEIQKIKFNLSLSLSIVVSTYISVYLSVCSSINLSINFLVPPCLSFFVLNFFPLFLFTCVLAISYFFLSLYFAVASYVIITTLFLNFFSYSLSSNPTPPTPLCSAKPWRERNSTLLRPHSDQKQCEATLFSLRFDVVPSYRIVS